MEYAIVDIETTGGSPSTSKITEIAIVITDGENIIDSYETLLFPEQNIPYNITVLTGISNQMVAHSPKFFEVAKTILSYLEGRVFVAHNVNFDYGFVKQEFKSLGFSYESEKMCTVRLSRKAFPGLASYSLGKLSKSLGVKLNNAHRAMADTMATVEVFHQIMRVQEDLDIVTNLAEKLGITKLPNKAGVYYFKDFDGKIIYVGKSINIKKRVQSHMRNFSTKRGITIMETIQSIEFKLTGNETMALLYETMEIKNHRPIHNRAQKKTKYPFGISINREDEFHKLEIREVNQYNDTIIEFSSRREAKTFMLDIIERFDLCQKLNGLENVNRVGSCFQYQLHNCNGGCIGEESGEDYNLRIEKFEAQYGYTNESGIYTSTGRKKSEISFIMLDNGIITGFGFTSSSMGLNWGSLQLLTEEFNPDKDFQRAFKTMKRNGKFEKAASF